MTAIEEGALRDMQARPPGAVLDELAKLGRALAASGRPRPDVELGLTSGQVIRGKVVAADATSAVLHTGGHVRAPSVAYVRIDQIASLVLPDASVLGHELAAATDTPVPTQVELARRVAGLMPPIAFAPLDDGARRAVGALLPTLQHALYQIASQAAGKAALALVDGLDVGSAPTGTVVREGKRIAIHAPLLTAEAFTVASLRAALERLL